MSRESREGGLRKALGWPSKFLFGDDIFISYSRADGATYAAGLADRLAGLNFSCRFDQWGTEPGREMPASLKGALRRSTLLVLVGSEGAAASVNVASEVAEMKRRGRRIVPVVFDGVLLRGGVVGPGGTLTRPGDGARAEALWAGDIEGLPASFDKREALKTGEPLAEVVSRVEKTFTFSRKDERLRRATTFVSALLLVLVGAAVVAGYVATLKGQEAQRRSEEAAAAEGRAREAERVAKQQEENARQQTARAEEAAAKATRAEALAAEKTQLADKATRLATEKTQLAAEKTKLAAEKSRLADEAAQRADEQSRRADEQTQRADAAARRAAEQELTARKNLARSFYAQAQADASADPLRALAWAGGAVAQAPDGDEGLPSYLLRTVNLAAGAPLSVVNTPAGVRSPSAGPDGATVVIVDESGRFSVWDARTGTPLPHPLPDPAADYVLDLTTFNEPVFSTDGRRAALPVWMGTSGPDATREPHLLVWEVRTGAVVQKIKLEGWADGELGRAHVGFKPDKVPTWYSFSPSGEELVVLTRAKDGMYVWDVADGSPRTYETPVEKEESSFDHLPFSRDPARDWFIEKRNVSAAVQGGKTDWTGLLRVREIKTGRVVGELTLLEKDAASGERVYFAGFTKDARKVVVYSSDKTRTLLRVWDVASGHVSRAAVVDRWSEGETPSMGHSLLDARGISPDGRSVILMSVNDSEPYGVAVWDISGDEPKEDKLYNFDSRLAGRRTLKVARSIYADDGVHVIDISNDFSERREVTVWDVRNGLLVSPPLAVTGGEVFDISTRDLTARVAYPDGTVFTYDLTRDGSLGVAGSTEQPPPSVLVRLLTPPRDLSSVLTTSEPRYGAERKRTLALRDPKTWALKWQAETTLSSYNVAKFSDDGARFVALHATPTSERGFGELLIHRTSDGAVEPGFRPIPGHWSSEAEFSRDGGSLVTETWSSANGVAVRRWSAKTGEPLPEPSGELRYREASFIGFTRFGEFCLTLPPGLGNDNYTEVTLRRVDEQLTPVITLRFAEHGAAGLAVALLRGAKEIHVASPGAVVLTLDSGVEVSAEAAPAGATLTNLRTRARVLPPLDSGVDFSKLVVSPDGRLMAARFALNRKPLARVWDAATGLPVSERLWHESEVAHLSFSADSKKLLTLTERGLVRSWFCGDFAGGAPRWAARAGEALGGLSVAGGADVRRLAPDEYVRARREFETALAEAAAAGDEAARFLLNALRR